MTLAKILLPPVINKCPLVALFESAPVTEARLSLDSFLEPPHTGAYIPLASLLQPPLIAETSP